MGRLYKKYIAEGKAPLYVAIIGALIIRITFAVRSSNISVPNPNSGYLWNLIEPYINNHEVLSCILSFAFALGIAFFISHLNAKYTIIRERTNLPFAFSIILLSCHPQLLIMNPEYIGILFFLLAADKLFSCYQQNTSPRIAFDIGFYLALGSLFTPDILIYLPFFWIGFSFMRSFKFRTILTSLLGIIFIYWIALFYFLSQDDIQGFYAPFIKWAELNYDVLPFSDYTYIDFGALLFGVIVVLVIILCDYADNYRDKIRIRANINYLNLILIFSILFYLFIPFKPMIALTVVFVCASLIISHFFALSNKRWQNYFFYIILFSFVSYIFFLN